MPKLFIPGRSAVTADGFVEFWEPLYVYPLEPLYTENIGKPLTPRRVRDLYYWKNGGKLSDAKRASVETNFIQRIREARALPKNTLPGDFLARFGEGGAIWRIYWLHMWQPERYPIYDQHVHRAMSWIQNGKASEIPSYDPNKIATYLEEYVPFVRESFRRQDQRRVDRALWACGKALKPFGPLRFPDCAGRVDA